MSRVRVLFIAASLAGALAAWVPAMAASPLRLLVDEHIPVTIAQRHAITDAVEMREIFDETYKGMWISPEVKVLLTTTHPLADPPLAWISPYARSRVVVIQLGHGSEAHRPASYRRLVKNAVLWTAGRLPS